MFQTELTNHTCKWRACVTASQDCISAAPTHTHTHTHPHTHTHTHTHTRSGRQQHTEKHLFTCVIPGSRSYCLSGEAMLHCERGGGGGGRWEERETRER